MLGKTISRANQRANLSKRTIESLPVPEVGRTYVYDAITPGLALCTMASGTRTFYSVRKIRGKLERVMIGRWPALTVERARDEAQRIAGRGVDGNSPNDAKRRDRGLPTLQEVFDVFIELPTRTKSKRPKSAKTVEGYRYQFDTFLSGWKNRRLSDVTRADVEKLHNKMATANGFYMANRVLSLLRVLYYTANDTPIHKGDPTIHQVANPAARITFYEEQSRDRRLEDDELPRFWMALEAEPSEKIRDFIKLALFTGQRRTNVLNMRWADVDFNRAVWTIPRAKSTTGHEVPLSAPVLEILCRRRVADPEGEFVLPGRHGREHLKDPMRQWRSILKGAGIANLRIHDLRRSIGSKMTDLGDSRPIVGKLLGHKREETTAVYGRVGMKPVRESLEAATAAILAATQPTKKQTRRTPKSSTT